MYGEKKQVSGEKKVEKLDQPRFLGVNVTDDNSSTTRKKRYSKYD